LFTSLKAVDFSIKTNVLLRSIYYFFIVILLEEGLNSTYNFSHPFIFLLK